MLLLSFVHEDSRIVWAINKLQNIIAGLIINPIPPFSDDVGFVGSINTASLIPVQMTGMILTPAAGKYLVTFSGDISTTEIAHTIMHVLIVVDGTSVAISERDIIVHNPTDFNSFCTQAIVTVNGIQAIEGYWYTTAGTVDNLHRQITIVKVR